MRTPGLCKISSRRGTYYGQNAISQNMIVADRRQLLNGNSFILGVSGSGKSFMAKSELINFVLATDADVTVIDPDREYTDFVRAFGGEVIEISASSANHINAMDSILNRITRNGQEGKQTFIFIDEFYILFQHEYSGQFLSTLWKRVRKYGTYCTCITQNLEEVPRCQTARLMLSNSEFIILMNQAPTERKAWCPSF